MVTIENADRVPLGLKFRMSLGVLSNDDDSLVRPKGVGQASALTSKSREMTTVKCIIGSNLVLVLA